MQELATREKSQPPPPHIVWETLVDPYRGGARQWLTIIENEAEPRVLEGERPSLVVWSSLWPDRPRDRIRFVISDDGRSGTLLKWILESDDGPPDSERLDSMRHRINYLINGEMRESFG